MDPAHYSSSPARIEVRVQAEAFQPGQELDRWCALSVGAGAVASFVGLVRDLNLGDAVSALHLEHYPGMTEKTLRGMCDQACDRWQLSSLAVIHRFGDLLPSEPIVMVMASSAHRADAFSACEFMMDFLKTQAPFWKREQTATGPRWVEERASDTEAAARWGVPT
jgi:molybdopterin synthase catalytic subunit